MATAKVVKMDGSEVGTVELEVGVFDARPNPGLVHEVAVALRNASRQGNASTKTRREVRGGGCKPYRQKGTGNARHGSSREPQMRGGGTVFGPHKRSYRQKVSPARKRMALCCVLSDQIRGSGLCVLDELSCDTPKTKPFAEMVDTLSTSGRRTLFVTAEVNENVLLSARNIPKVEVRTATDLNTLDVLEASQVIIERNALPRLQERLA